MLLLPHNMSEQEFSQNRVRSDLEDKENITQEKEGEEEGQDEDAQNG